MAVVKVTNSKATLNKAISYITKEEKTEDKLISGQNCNPKTALEEMQTTKEQFNKTDGRQYYHYVQSFAKTDKLTHEQAHEIGREWAEKNFKKYEVLIATHQDKNHIHNHFIVNSVSFEDGSKLHSRKQDLEHLKEMSDRICEREGLSVIKEPSKEITSFKMTKYRTLERALEGGYKSYVADTALSVDRAISASRSKEEFIRSMNSQGYSVKWSDTNKNVTFKDREGHKVRLSNLAKTFKDNRFSKEGLENEFSKSKGKELREPGTDRTQGDNQRGGAKTPGRNAPNVDWSAIRDNVEGEGNRVSKQPGHDVVGEIQRKVRSVKERTDRATGISKPEDKSIAGQQPGIKGEPQTRDTGHQQDSRPKAEPVKPKVPARSEWLER